MKGHRFGEGGNSLDTLPTMGFPMSSPVPEDEGDDYYVREAAEAAAKQPDQTSIQPEEIVLNMYNDGIYGQALGWWSTDEEIKFHKDAAYDQCAEHCLAKGCSCFTVEIE